VSYRVLHIESDSRISLSRRQLCLKKISSKNDDDELSLPIEDIGCIVVSSSRYTITAKALNYISESGAALIFCDDKYLPSTTLLPLSGHYKILEIVNTQLNLKVPFKKNLWSSVVKSKIRNQDHVLLKSIGESKISHLVRKILSGDATNIEAQAARIYWQHLFLDKSFKRSNENILNGALNFGYAIIRSCLARSLTSCG
jgi:CRISP-associated protein Cas1